MNIKLPGIVFKNLVYNGAGSFQYLDFQWTTFAKKLNFLGLSALTLKTNSWYAKHTSDNWNELIYWDLEKKYSANCVGLQGPDARVIARKIIKLKKQITIPLIASVAGDSKAELVKNVKLIASTPVNTIEINLSCPNSVKKVIVATDEMLTYEYIKACKIVTSKPLYVKLSPSVTDIVKIAQVATKAGADALVINNCHTGLILDDNYKPVLLRTLTGFSSAGVLPITLANIYRVVQAVTVPLILLWLVVSILRMMFYQQLLAGQVCVKLPLLLPLMLIFWKKLITKLISCYKLNTSQT